MSASGGTYRLCWCSAIADCDGWEEAIVDAGTLLVVGPQHHQDRTCIAGNTCVLNHIRGQAISDADRVLVRREPAPRFRSG